VIPDLWRVADALARIRIVLAAHPEGGALARFLPPIAPEGADRPLKARATVASTFLAGLELAKDGILSADQVRLFGPIRFGAVPAGRLSH
jgi:segregation and condensation protein A